MPDVDVVVPFVGSGDALIDVCEKFSRLDPGEGGSIVVVDNRPGTQREGRELCGVMVLHAPEIQSSYYARNQGATHGKAPWLLFMDADVIPDPEVIRNYFGVLPEQRTAVLAGEIVDEVPASRGRASAAVIYAHEINIFKRLDEQPRAFVYAMTANAAVRRSAFEAVGGFVNNIRSGGDADLCFRLRDAGWSLEGRSQAVVTHLSRPSVQGLIRQSLRHGSGAAWLEVRYPGFFRRSGLPRTTLRTLKATFPACRASLRRDRRAAYRILVDAARGFAYEAGALFSNDVALRGDSISRHAPATGTGLERLTD